MNASTRLLLAAASVLAGGTLLVAQNHDTPGGEVTEPPARAVRLTVDLGQAMNDVAFWAGTPPDDYLVVISRQVRSGFERMTGRPSHTELSPDVIPAPETRGTGPNPLPFPDGGPRQYVTVEGFVEPLPYPEARYSWGLTDRDEALVTDRGEYVRVVRMSR